MYGNAKNTANYLAKSETLPTFALPKLRCISSVHIFNSHTASLLSGVASICNGVLANFRKGLASFVVYIIKLSDQCQNSLKVASRYKVSTLRLPYPYLSRIYPRNPYPSSPFRTNLLPTSCASLENGATKELPSNGYSRRNTLCSHWAKLCSNSAKTTLCIA